MDAMNERAAQTEGWMDGKECVDVLVKREFKPDN